MSSIAASSAHCGSFAASPLLLEALTVALYAAARTDGDVDPTVEATTYRAGDGRAFDGRVFSVTKDTGSFKVTVVDMPDDKTGEELVKNAFKPVAEGGASEAGMGRAGDWRRIDRCGKSDTSDDALRADERGHHQLGASKVERCSINFRYWP